MVRWAHRQVLQSPELSLGFLVHFEEDEAGEGGVEELLLLGVHRHKANVHSAGPPPCLVAVQEGDLHG